MYHWLAALEIDKDLYRGDNLWTPTGSRGVFGGHILAQSLAAAVRTAPEKYILHVSKTFCTRTVQGKQKGTIIVTITFSFQIDRLDPSLDHQYLMPDAPNPETLKSQAEGISPTLSEYFTMRNPKVLISRLCRYDHHLLWTGGLPHGLTHFSYPRSIAMITSLDHALWFHAPFRADEWLLCDMESSRTTNGRAFTQGRFYNQQGVLVASTAQEGVLLDQPTPQLATELIRTHPDLQSVLGELDKAADGLEWGAPHRRAHL
ncbi:HotDog domain-containing protein [Dimargaris cristalligena]|uniref:HotDog domain-containing protein n=1 Tax=Dimargaris cristalligena TaxID=215637 RepID=A0A4P9ZRM5_9FUNG|nr:HotDog domain-containing protein [Dimargaris cristalligena]|eukprot:RKP35302.1 HotDog domain-containing protein [Dimargaris cristalligena]